MRLAALFLLAASSVPVFVGRSVSAQDAAATVPAPDAKLLKGGYAFKEGGWTYVHLQGTPEQIGYQHGYLLAREIEDSLHVYQVEGVHLDGRPWKFFRNAGRMVLWPGLDSEYKRELKGIAEGLKAQGSKVDLWDVVAMNGDEELTGYYLPWFNAKEGKPNPKAAVAPGKCSAFIATGSATKDGKIVIAHSNWSPYAEGERWTVAFDIVPVKGHHILMDGTPGVITSQDDFGVNSAGLMITETTLPMFKGFNPMGIAEFERSRKAMQYASSIDEYAAIMREGNNGGYANSWLVGDRKTGEIAYLELGLNHTPLEKKRDGYFVSSNFSKDPLVIRDDTPGFNPMDLSTSMNARRVTATAFMQDHYGKIDTELAEAYLSDHYDSYDKKIEEDRRSLCGHEEVDPVGEKVWGSKAFSPSGAVTGKVMDSDMAAKMSFTGRAGHPCGENFLVEPFLAAHPEFEWERPILGDMKAGPWTTFTADETAPAAEK